MVTTVTGPVGATYDAVFAGLTATLVRTGGVVGYAPSGGAIAPDQKTYTTDGSGVLTMADLKPGKYELTLFVPINEGVSQTVLWKAKGTVLPDAGDNITLAEFLVANVEPLTPSLVQQAIAAADRAEAAAAAAEAALTGVLWYITDDTTSVTVGVGLGVVVQDPGPGPYDTVTLEVA